MSINHQNQGHVDSYYAASANSKTPYPQLDGHLQADVVVVGGGYSGLSSALHLAELGFSVIVLEASRIGFGASGRNGGQIVNSYSRDVDTLRAKYKKELAEPLCEMIFEGGDIIRERINTYNIKCDLKQGGIFAAKTHKQLKGLAHTKKAWEALGNNQLQLLDSAAIREHVDTDLYVGGLLDNRSGHIHPLNLALGEADALIRLGGQIFEMSPVERIDKGDSPVAYTKLGSVKAKFMVLAGNAYLGNLEPKLTTKAIPCGTQVVTTEQLDPELARSLLPTDVCVEDCNYLLDYYRLTGDNRLLFGGGVVYGARDPDNIERLLRPNLEKTFPQLKGIKLDYAWTGNFLLTYSRMPQFGRFGNSVYYLQGYSGHGVTCTHLAGKLVAEAINGQAKRFDAFANLPQFSFPGGRNFAIPMSAMGAAWYGLRDKLGF
ncbi:NAD(P)/FAD-dependent oxidoreductase [Umboniibacter marinipuniceus]|uniref:Gamma-glutamylputrescine oxidase n=1 Tax=Umboniibacter marinipuniceus TaxID=569599 RepID=A0A3M0AAQ7_9GAMM|nr:FAD-binding oxidoreductase [Umboniibacter marinipuniceus]RMA79475.1 gamma-glutamylputrescine oxidase [Umboniibacter marinipuniceus]